MTERDPVERIYPPDGLINYADVRGVLAAAWPELAGPIDDSDQMAIEEGLPYLEMAAIARYLDERMRAGKSDCFDPVFEAVEQCLLWGSYEAVELVMVGLLEDLQNANIPAASDYAQWEPYLRPQTRVAWKAVSDFWRGHPSALQRYEGRRWSEKA
jgi:hypothetical protein